MINKRVGLVTGGGRGIGRAISVELAKKGWMVVVNYHQNAVAADETVAQIHTLGGSACAIQADIGVSADRARLIDKILSDYERIDLLVNNAGVAPRQRKDILEVSEPSYDEVMTVNLKGSFFLTQAVARVMINLIKTQNIADPIIINIGSMSAYTSSPERSEYCLSKAGVSMMTLLFADRLAEFGIRVYEIRPGIISTDMTREALQRYDRLIAEGLTPIRRHGEPHDVARAVAVVAEGCLPYSTGEVINIDGGFHIRRL
jgi:NAD(P)-dependent dehydrogenase (short-subunit alcohol dehydrogenase family)